MVPSSSCALTAESRQTSPSGPGYSGLPAQICGHEVIHVKYVNRKSARMNLAIKHNITVAIDPALLKRARAVATSRGLSVSALLASQLRDLVAQDSQYKAARKRAASLLASPLPLGGTPLPREALHERRRIR
jgi:hypothetical protein